MLFTLKVDNFSREEAINYTRRSAQLRANAFMLKVDNFTHEGLSANAFMLKVDNFTHEEMHEALQRGAFPERR